MLTMVKVVSAAMSFIMLMLPFSKEEPERICEPKFSGTFIQSWMTHVWDEARWDEETENMKNAGIEYLVVQCIADKAYKKNGGGWTVYYDSDVEALRDAKFPGDSLEPALRSCQKAGIKAFVGLSMFEDFWGEAAMGKQYYEICDVAADMIKDIYSKYGEAYADTLYGWYYTPEISNGLLCQLNVRGLARGINTMIDAINETDASKPLLLSPFYSDYIATDALTTASNYARFFHYVNFRDGDIFAPQDAVGAGWTKEKNLEKAWKVYKAAISTCDKDVKLWANCENFSSAFGESALAGITGPGKTEYTSNVTAPLSRFVKQMDVASRYAENIITFSYNHYYSPSYCNSAFIDTYLDYVRNGYVLEAEAPSSPFDLSASEADGEVTVSWNAASDNFGIAYYRVERNGEFLVRIEVGKDASSEFSCVDTSPLSGAQYTVTAFDAAGNMSQPASVTLA